VANYFFFPMCASQQPSVPNPFRMFCGKGGNTTHIAPPRLPHLHHYFPEGLAKQVVAVADEESRNISELVREAFRTYCIEKMHQRLAQIRAEAAKRTKTQYTEKEVESLVDEIGGRNFRKRKNAARSPSSIPGSDLGFAIRRRSCRDPKDNGMCRRS
jgi:hypothetical protein